MPARLSLDTLDGIQGITADLQKEELEASDSHQLLTENLGFAMWTKLARGCLHTAMKQAGSYNDPRWNEGPPDTGNVVESKPAQPLTATVSSSESSSEDSSSDSDDDNLQEVVQTPTNTPARNPFIAPEIV